MSDGETLEPRIVHAVALSVSSQEHGSDVAKYVETAMQNAILKANEEGIPITDSVAIKARMIEAQNIAMDELRAAGVIK